MFSRTKQKAALRRALDRKDPKRQDGTRKVINWSMIRFRHALFECAEIESLKRVSFEFPQEKIEKQLTTAILESESRIIKMTYDYKTDSVECYCIGKDKDLEKDVIDVTQIRPYVMTHFPRKKRIIVIRRKSK